MGGWSSSASKLLNSGTGGSTSIAPFSSGPGGTVPQNLLTSPGYFQPPTQDFANQIFGRKSGQEQQLFLADILAQLGVGNLGAGAQTLQQPLNYYSGILSGDRQQMLETVAPEVNTILGQYDTAKRAVSENAPRGGGTATTLANAPYSLSGQITNLLNTVRPQAAAATTDIGKFLDTLGTTQTGQAGGLINANTLAQLAKTGQQGAAAGLLGSAIGGLLPSLLGLIPHGTPQAPDLSSVQTVPTATVAPSVLPSYTAVPSATDPLSGVNLPSLASVPTVPTASLLAESGSAVPPPGVATSALSYINPATGSLEGLGGAGAASADTAGGLAPETGMIGTDISSGSILDPLGNASFLGTGADTGASAAGTAAGGGAGGGGTSGGISGLLASSSPAALAGGAAFGAGLPLAVLGLMGIGPSQIFQGVPDKQTQQSVIGIEGPVIKGFIDYTMAPAQNPQELKDAYDKAVAYVNNFASGQQQGGWYKATQQQQLQQLQQAYQQLLAKMQGAGG